MTSFPLRRRASRAMPFAAVLVGGLLVAGCAAEEVQVFGTAEARIDSVTRLISSPASVVSRTYPATVVAEARADVLAPSAGRLVRLTVADGDVVAEGEVVAVLRADGLTGGLRQAESALLTATMTLRANEDALARSEQAPAQDPLTFRNRVHEVESRLAEVRDDIIGLRRDGDAAGLRLAILEEQALLAEYDAWVRRVDAVTAARAALAQAEQALGQARNAVGDLTLRAPVSGSVRLGVDLATGGGRPVAVGVDVAPGQPLVTIAAAQGFRLELRVPESGLGPVTLGARVAVDLEAFPGTPLEGTVQRIDAVGTPGPTGTVFTAEVALDDERGLALRTGLTGTAVLPRLAFTDRYEVQLEVDEVDVVLVAVGQRVSIELDALRGTSLAGTVVALAATPERQPTGGTFYRARVRLDTPAGAAPTLRGGLTGTADIEVQRLDDVLTVPTTALLRSGGSEVVYVVRDGVAIEVPVTVLAFGEALAAVAGDLVPGERVVTSGVERVTAGTSVDPGAR
jgi:HlyD family secretion protein